MSDLKRIIEQWASIPERERDAAVKLYVFGETPEPLPPYTTNAAAAMTVIEKLCGRWWFTIKSPFIHDTVWSCGVCPLGLTGWTGTPDYYAQGSTMAEAVCRAALTAISTHEARAAQ